MHLTIRVAWHDNQWDGTICRAPSRNSFCIALDRIREAPRDDDNEDRLAGKSWAELSDSDLPPCAAEGGETASGLPQDRFRYTPATPPFPPGCNTGRICT